MIRNADYIYDNVIIADNVNTTKEYCKKAQVGVDLSVKKVFKVVSRGAVLSKKTLPSNYLEIEPDLFEVDGVQYTGWWLFPGWTYICELNEGCSFGKEDTGLIIMRSSLNRCGASVNSAVWDPGYTTEDNNGNINPMGVRINIDNINGVFFEQNARIAQLVVFKNEPVEELYNGQWQGGKNN